MAQGLLQMGNKLIGDTLGRVGSAVSALEEHIVNDWLTGGWTPSQIPDLHGKTALVTGGNSGMGFETCRKLAENGAKVYLVARESQKGHEAASRIRSQVGKAAQVEVLQCDLSSLSNVLALAKEFKGREQKLDILVNMAGVFYPGPFQKTKDGIEQTLAIDFYAHALLTLALLDTLRATPGSRVIMMASGFELIGKLDWGNLRGEKDEHARGSGGFQYATAKVYKMMFARELSSRVPEVDFFCVHPGGVASPLHAKSSWAYPSNWFLKPMALLGQSPYRGSFSTLYAATEPSLKGKHFGYFCPNLINMNMTRERQPGNAAVRNPVACWKLFEESCAVMRQAVGPNAMPPVPPHPDDPWARKRRV